MILVGAGPRKIFKGVKPVSWDQNKGREVIKRLQEQVGQDPVMQAITDGSTGPPRSQPHGSWVAICLGLQGNSVSHLGTSPYSLTWF